jgi:hypothetical protein
VVFAPKWRLRLEAQSLADVAAAVGWPALRDGKRLLSLRCPSCGRGGVLVGGRPTGANLAHYGRRYWHQQCRGTGGPVELLSAALLGRPTPEGPGDEGRLEARARALGLLNDSRSSGGTTR